jgi:hypothetical protein
MVASGGGFILMAVEWWWHWWLVAIVPLLQAHCTFSLQLDEAMAL